VTIGRLELVAQPDADTAVFEAECGKGTYVRALARDMGRALGCYGHVSALRRTRVGPFLEADALTIDRLQELGGREALAGALLPPAVALAQVPGLVVSSSDAARLRHGQPVLLRGRDAPVLSGPAYATCRGELVAIGEIDKGELRPARVFNWG
jgi:tRNA pseudouridine55 synthase